MNTEAKPQISIFKGLKAVAGLALFAGIGGMALFFLEPGLVEAALSAAGVNSAYAAAIVLVLRGASTAYLNWRKHNPATPSNQNAGPLILLLLALTAPVFAQERTPLELLPATSPSDAMDPTAAPDPDPTPATTPSGVELTLHGGAMQFAERGQPDKRDFVYRLTLTIPAPSGLTLFARADYTRTQDGGDLLDPKTFRSIEGFAGGRKDIGSGFAVTAFGGATWNRDAHFEPTDARLYTAAVGVRFAVPGRGYVIAAAGHHGPVGGSAFLASVTYEINSGASWFADIAIPLDAERFEKRPYTAKVGISARLKGWNF